jgi:hypothetical protein
MFNKIEDKLTRFVLSVITLIMLLGVGFMAVRYMPPLFKLVGVMADIVGIWFFIKYIRFELKKKKKD